MKIWDGDAIFTTRLMSRAGLRGRQPMSALPPKADMCGALLHVCYGPIADIIDVLLSTAAIRVHRQRERRRRSNQEEYFYGASTLRPRNCKPASI